MSTHYIKKSKTDFDSSYWLEALPQLPYLLPTGKLESEYIEEIVAQLLSEFIHTDEAMKQNFERILTDWLIEMSEKEEEEEEHQVQSLIYEMF